MVNPVLAEVTRGPLVESRHRGAIAVSDARRHLLLALGDVGQVIYPRSAVKALQALPLVESGAADAFGFGDDELALACASHNGEARHVQTAAAMLESAGLSEADLACGPQPPRREEDMAALQRRGVPTNPRRRTRWSRRRTRWSYQTRWSLRTHSPCRSGPRRRPP